MNKKINVKYNGESAYNIAFSNSFDGIISEIEALNVSSKKICIVTDSNVAPLYGKKLKNTLEKVCKEVVVVSFEAGETSKHLETVQKIYDVLVMKKFDRNDMLFALGGGVVGDITGFVAATYMRGIDFVQVPTTLLAMVDSSVGGKTGVDYNNYKNIIGAFKMPKLVYVNIDTLKTLPEREFNAGMAEVIKYGLIMSSDFYDYLIAQASNIRAQKPKTLLNVIYMCCKFKQAVVEKDPLEKGLRKILNFGHTAGHSIEKLKEFQLLHGECVSLGMLQAMRFSMNYSGISDEDVNTLYHLLDDFDLPTSTDNLDAEMIVKEIANDKKMASDSINFVILNKVGHAKIKKVNLLDENDADYKSLADSINTILV